MTAREFVGKFLKGRPQPSAPTLGVKKSRYTTGGKITRKKNV